MEQELLNLVSARKGHYRLESGYHGGLWFDLDPLFVAPARIQPLVEMLAERLQRHNIEAVCGPLVGGALLAQALASLLDIEFYYAQRFAPAMPDNDSLYPVQYHIPRSVGSMVRGTLSTLEANGARPVATGALLVLGAQAERFCQQRGLALEYIAQLPYEVWLPAECPLCASGALLEDMAQ